MSEWKTYKLEELCTAKGSYGIAAPAVLFDASKYTYLRITDINDDGTLNYGGLMSVDDKHAGNYLLKENDIVFARTGNSTGRTYFYDGTDGELVYAGFLIKFSLDSDKVNPRILKYYTHSQPYYDWVRSFDTGGTRGNINAKVFGAMPITLPPRNLQDRIVEILKSLDDKIELNRRINANLEEQAQALFKSWFVDFEPFKDGPFVDSELGEIPQGWKVNTIEDLASYIASGGTPRTLDTSYYDGDIRWFTTKELKDGFLFDSEKHISQTALENSAAKLFPQNTVLMAIYASPTVGRLGILTAESTCNQAAVGIIAKEEIGYIYLYLLLLSERVNLNNLASGAAQQNLNVGIIKRYRVLVPPIDILNVFNKVITPIFSIIRNNTAQIYSLSALRDALLPKLMKGEIKVN